MNSAQWLPIWKDYTRRVLFQADAAQLDELLALSSGSRSFQAEPAEPAIEGLFADFLDALAAMNASDLHKTHFSA